MEYDPSYRPVNDEKHAPLRPRDVATTNDQVVKRPIADALLARAQRTVAPRMNPGRIARRSHAPLAASAAPRFEARRRGDTTVIRRALAVDGNAVDSPEDVKDAGEDLKKTISRLISVPGPVVKLTRSELDQVQKYLADQTRPASVAAIFALLQLVSYGTVFKPSGRGLAERQVFNDVKAMGRVDLLGRFLEANPNVVKNLQHEGIGWELFANPNEIGRTDQITGFGGAALKDEKVKVTPEVIKTLPEQNFMRATIHEVGHGTFQRLLIDSEHWTSGANKGQEDPSAKALDDDGRKFYASWKVLAANREYFFITELHRGLPEAYGDGRRGYLAGSFAEFCAESFMHFAIEREGLKAHIAMLQEDANVPGAVNTAWKGAYEVLVSYEDRILGSKPWERDVK